MRIGVQILSLRPHQVGGQEVFIRRLLQGMIAQLGDDQLVLCLRPELTAAPRWSSLVEEPVETIVESPDVHYGDGYAVWNLQLLEKAALDVVYFPLHFFYPRPLPIPVAIHVPDIQYEYFPEYFPPDQLTWRRERIPESVALADAVITPSRFSADCLREKLHAEQNRLHVIGEGGFLKEDLEAALSSPTSVAHLSGGQPFYFYPATDWPHKDHEVLLRAAALLAQRGRPEHLVLTGMFSLRSDTLRALADELGLANRVHFLGHVSQDELVGLYRAARLMAFPSRFEGFGLPLVEAMQLGCPIVASKANGVVETAGEAALFCDNTPDDWARTLIDVLDDSSLRDELRQRGRQRAARFDWTFCAAQHLSLLRGLARSTI